MDIVTAIATGLAALAIVGIAVVMYFDVPFRTPGRDVRSDRAAGRR